MIVNLNLSPETAKRLSDKAAREGQTLEGLLQDLAEHEACSNGSSAASEPWSDELNARRIELIDKDIQGNITTQERVELAELQRKAVAYRDREAPLPIEGARRLHKQLLEMKRQRESS